MDSPGSGTPLDRTGTGVVKGTWAYMAPEQARGEKDKIGPATDVFALGGILCRILTGRPTLVVEGFAFRAMAGDLSEAFGRLDRSGADPALIALAKRFLEPDATARIPNAGAAAEAVAAYRSGVEERLRRTENDRARAEARAAELRKRRKVQAALAVALVILVAGGGIAGWWYDRTVEKRRSDTELANLAERERLARNEQAIEIELAQADSALGHDDAIAKLGKRLRIGTIFVIVIHPQPVFFDQRQSAGRVETVAPFGGEISELLDGEFEHA